MKLKSDVVSDTEKVGEVLGKLLGIDDVVCLIGGLGAGKTAFTRGLSRGWGSGSRVTSPTFTLINEYTRSTDDQIMHHLDCYRLSSNDDVETIGLDDILNTDGPTIIEWPEVVVGWLPADYIAILIEPVTTAAENGRWVSFQSTGPHSSKLVEELADRLMEEEK
ncbi:MAG: tRNA (adenosine(37)-N6)-threonylcarbamoyltransferase complex ATPase subunit type 1 TsaE [Chloroflexota bacterium]